MARQAAYDRADALQKACNLFWARGYHGTSVKDIEAALDMRPGSIYAAFGSKEGLFAEALEFYAALGRAEFIRIVGSAASPLEGIAAYIHSIAERCDDNAPSQACMLAKTVLEMPEDDPVLRRSAEALMSRVEAGFIATFREAQAQGQLPAEADPERLGRRLQAQIIGLRAYAQRTDTREKVHGIAEDMAADILSMQATPATAA